MLERALADHAANRRRRIGALAPQPVEAVVVAVEPEREPTGPGRSAEGRADFIFGAELPVENIRADFTDDGRTRLRAEHPAQERVRSTRADHVPRTARRNQRL